VRWVQQNPDNPIAAEVMKQEQWDEKHEL